MARRHNEQSVIGRSQTDYMWTGYRVQSRCSLCGTPLRVQPTYRKLRKGSILRGLLASTVSTLLLRALMLVQRWFGTCERPVYLSDSGMLDDTPTGSEVTDSDGGKASAIIPSFLALVAALVIGRTIFRRISRRRRDTVKGSSTSVVSKVGTIFSAILAWLSRSRRALQKSYSTSRD
jgi:hypothetical protein